MLKRIVSLLLVLVLCMCLLPSAFAADTGAHVPEEPDKTVYHGTNLDLNAILPTLQQDDRRESASVEIPTQAPARSAYDDFYFLPELNYVGQYRVVGDRMNLDFEYYTPGKLNLDWYMLIYYGDPNNDDMVYSSHGEISTFEGYSSERILWFTDGSKVGTYTVVLFAATRTSDPQILENSVLAYYVYLTDTAVPMTGARLVNVITGEEVTSISIAAGTEGVLPVTVEFFPANTTDSRWAHYFTVWDDYVQLYTLGGLLYYKADKTCTVPAEVYGNDFTVLFTIYCCTDDQGHSYSPVTAYPDSQPTCTEEGLGTGFCTKCRVKDEVAIPALGHDWVAGEVLVPEEGDNWGTRTETCSRCGETQEVPYHTCPADAFKDRVPESSWAHRPIDYVLRHGLMNGMSATKFEPNGTLTRAQLVTILYRLAGEEAVETEVPFTDLTQAWYKDAVAWAFENGIVNGMTDTTFAPNVKVNRAMFATIMFRYYSQYLGLEAEERADLSAFPDAGKVASWAAEPMAWANAKGLINGVSRGGKVYLDPAASATRAQAATILMRFCEMIG